jgi:hypothetical protein
MNGRISEKHKGVTVFVRLTQFKAVLSIKSQPFAGFLKTDCLIQLWSAPI